MTKADYTIIFDGGSIGNPGRGYGSFALFRNGDGAQRITRLEFPGRLTNNEAEYDTLIGALRHLLDTITSAGRSPADFTLEVRGDSLLVISQVAGRWKARDARMMERRDQVQALAKQFKRVAYVQHPRAESVKVLGH